MKRLTATYSFALLLAIFTVPPPAFSQIREVRTIPLVAMTHDGRVVGGLTAQNLRVRGINGRVDKVTLDAGPRHIILLLDVSGSMREESDPSAWDKARELANAFLEQVSPEDWIALDVFAEREKEIVPFTHDFASIRAAIQSLPSPGSKQANHVYGDMTFAGDAIAAILYKPNLTMGFGDSIVFFSDGRLTGNDAADSKLPLGSICPELERRQVRVFLALASSKTAVQLRLGDLGPGESAVTDAKRLVAMTGGATFEPIMPLAERMATLYLVIQGTYRTELQLEQSLPKKKRLHLTLVDEKGKAIHNIILFYTEDLVPDSRTVR